MANESIRVFYEPLGQLGGNNYYHETLLYTNALGQQFIATAGPTGSPPAGTSNATQILQPSIAAETGGTSIFGTLWASSGPLSNYNSQQLDGYLGPAGNPNPSDLVAVSANLSQQWASITSAASAINALGLPYSPATQNSNSAATTELLEAGITPPSTSISGPHWAPAADNQLLVPNPDSSSLPQTWMLSPISFTTDTVSDPSAWEVSILSSGAVFAENTDESSKFFGTQILLSPGAGPGGTTSGTAIVPTATGISVLGAGGSQYNVNGSTAVDFSPSSGQIVAVFPQGTVNLDAVTGAVLNSGTVAATVNNPTGTQTITLLGTGGSSPFALISNDNTSSDASASSSIRGLSPLFR